MPSWRPQSQPTAGSSAFKIISHPRHRLGARFHFQRCAVGGFAVKRTGMDSRTAFRIFPSLVVSVFILGTPGAAPAAAVLPSLGDLFYTTAAGRTPLPDGLVAEAQKRGFSKTNMPDGRCVEVSLKRAGKNFELALSATPATGILTWGLAVDASADEYFTGLMERVVDGPQDGFVGEEHHQRP